MHEIEFRLDMDKKVVSLLILNQTVVKHHVPTPCRLVWTDVKHGVNVLIKKEFKK